jgi:DNA-binding response OmpR family regulator
MANQPVPINSPNAGKASGLVILVEDDSKLRKLYSDMLRSLGYTVITAKDGEEGLSLLFTNVPRLLLLDIIMPNMDGIELCRRAREILGPRIPILFLTALDQLEIVQVCLEAGGDDYIVKGSDLKTIANRVRHWTKVGSSRKAEKHRNTALAAIKSEMSQGVGQDGSHGGLSSQTDEVVRDIVDILNKAIRFAGPEFGSKVEEKLYLMGYAMGLVNYWSVAKTHIKSRVDEYLKAVLGETELFVGAEIQTLVGAVDKLASDEIFTVAVSKGTADAVTRKARTAKFVPAAFAKFAEDFEQKSKFGALYSKVFSADQMAEG